MYICVILPLYRVYDQYSCYLYIYVHLLHVSCALLLIEEIKVCTTCIGL